MIDEKEEGRVHLLGEKGKEIKTSLWYNVFVETKPRAR